MNIQYAIYDNTVYILEANPRASRTVPLVSKVCNISMAKIATQLLLGQKLSDFNLKNKTIGYYGVKEAVFPFNMFPAIDPLLGPEMRSTGEVLGMADSYGMAFFKAQEATSTPLPVKGTVLITIADRDKDRILETARNFKDMGFTIISTAGTRQFLANNGIEAKLILKVHEGRPNIVDAIKNGEINLVVNTPAGRLSEYDDSYIRKNAIKYKIPYITTSSAALSSTNGIKERQNGEYKVKSLQEYHSEIED
jgi:carbamoyl-phosphate synthase large subunit